MVYKAQQLKKKQTLVLIEKEMPSSIPSEHILLKIKVAGICGSDIEYYKHGYCAKFIPQTPFVLGHEFVGEVIKIGEAVTNISVGDAVVVDPTMPCSTCMYCKEGRYNFCTHMKMFGSASCMPHIDGGFEEYVVVPSKNCLVFDTNSISWNEACLVEPLMVAISAVSKIQSLPFKSVAVFGGGTIGLLIVAVLKAFGVKSCAIVDPRKESRELGTKLGADNVYEPYSCDTLFDVCIEVAGHPDALLQCYSHVNIGGMIVQVGTITEQVSLPVNVIMSKELTVQGVFRYRHLFEIALDMLLSKKVVLDSIITHRIPLENLDEGFRLLLDKNTNTLKVQVNINH